MADFQFHFQTKSDSHALSLRLWFSLLLRDSGYPLAWLSFDTEKKESFADKVKILSKILSI